MPNKLKWTVEIEVDKALISDGFTITEERVLTMLHDNYGFAYQHEFAARILSAPDESEILKLQGAL